MVDNNDAPSNPAGIAAKGQNIYETKYREEYERSQVGRFVAIDVNTETAFLGDTPVAAIQAGKAASPTGMFHLVRVGFPGVYRVGYALTGGQFGDWIFGER